MTEPRNQLDEWYERATAGSFTGLSRGEGLPLLTLGALKVRVRILETRTVYGRTEVLVEPVAGEGKCWVTEGKVTR